MTLMSLIEPMQLQRWLTLLAFVLPIAACAQQEGEAAPGAEEQGESGEPNVEVVANEAESRVDVRALARVVRALQDLEQVTRGEALAR